MKKIIIAFIFIGVFCLSVTAQEAIYFSDYIAEDGSGLELLQKIYKKRVNKKDVYTTHDIVDDSCEQVELVTVLLNEAVMKKVRELSVEQGMVVLKSHQQWWKYFKATPSLPDVNGSERGICSLMTDFQRIKARWAAVRLPYKQYLVYAQIANFCKVRLDCGTYKMRFGEVCLKKEACWAYDENAVKTFGKYYHAFPIEILPETCRKSEFGYVAVLQNAQSLYLCTWGIDGMPLAVHALKNVKKISSISPKTATVEIIGIDPQNKQQNFIFYWNEINQIKISSQE